MHPMRIAVEQQGDQHVRVEPRTPPVGLGPRPAGVERRGVHRGHHIDQEPGQMVLGQPLRHQRRQQKRLITVNRPIRSRHKRDPRPPRSRIPRTPHPICNRLCNPRGGPGTPARSHNPPAGPPYPMAAVQPPPEARQARTTIRAGRRTEAGRRVVRRVNRSRLMAGTAPRAVEHEIPGARLQKVVCRPRILFKAAARGRRAPRVDIRDLTAGFPQRPRDATNERKGVDGKGRLTGQGWRGRVDLVWTVSTICLRTSGSADGGTPWPRLKMWPGAARPSARIRSIWASRTGQPAESRAGSRLPWTGLAGPAVAIRRTASSRGTRQSTPITSAPAVLIRASSSPVFTPKWSRGTPYDSSAANTFAECGSTNSA